MPAPLSVDLRQRIITAYEAKKDRNGNWLALQSGLIVIRDLRAAQLGGKRAVWS